MMLLNLSRLSSQLTKEAADANIPPLVKSARHGPLYRAARAVALSRGPESAALNVAKSRAVAQVANPRQAAVARNVSRWSDPLEMVHDMPGEWLPPGALISEAKTPVVSSISTAPSLSAATAIDNPMLTAPTVLSHSVPAVAADTPSIIPNLQSLRSASERHVLPQAIPVEDVASASQRVARAPVHAPPSINQKDISTQVVKRKKKAPPKQTNKFVAPITLGSAGGGTAGYVASSGPQEKAAGVIDLPFRAATSLVGRGLQGGISLGKFMTKTPLRRKIFGTTALVGGLGAYGASKGLTAQDPYAQNPMTAPTPYGKALQYAVGSGT